jgi:hypothetical protein
MFHNPPSKCSTESYHFPSIGWMGTCVLILPGNWEIEAILFQYAFRLVSLDEWMDGWIPALVLQGFGIPSDRISVVAVSFHWMNRKLRLAINRHREEDFFQNHTNDRYRCTVQS